VVVVGAESVGAEEVEEEVEEFLFAFGKRRSVNLSRQSFVSFDLLTEPRT
jgi:hypothetical protein